MQVHNLADIDAQGLFDRVQEVPDETGQVAQAIVAQVANYGDKAVQEITKRLDGVQLETAFVPTATWHQAADSVHPKLAAAIDANLGRIQAFHQLQVGDQQTLEVAPGVLLGRRPVAHQVAGCYVPGGRASYPSTVLMTVTPAKLAGVARIIVATPPQKDGSLDPAVAYAARAAGATDILQVGGAQAIAALAYGTKKIPRADTIVGPGNAYVTAAKRIVSGLCWTDAPAGPSEVLLIADDEANPEHLALDLVAQAEHDPDAQCILLCTSRDVAQAAVDGAKKLMGQSERHEIIEASLNDNSVAIVATLDEAIQFANDYAAEHVHIHTKTPRDVANQIRNAGSIFIGANATVALGDYGSGTNHVLPTMGFARVRGGLGVDDFRKWVTWQEVTAEGLQSIGSDVATLARAEGLVGHAQAVERRMES